MKRWKAEKLAIKKGVRLTHRSFIPETYIYFCHDDHEWYYVDSKGNENKYCPYLPVIDGWKIYKGSAK